MQETVCWRPIGLEFELGTSGILDKSLFFRGDADKDPGFIRNGGRIYLEHGIPPNKKSGNNLEPHIEYSTPETDNPYDATLWAAAVKEICVPLAEELYCNNVDLENDRLMPAKRKYNPFKKALVIGTGFPDFIVIQFVNKEKYDVFGVEVKVNGLLSKEEKEKCILYLKNNIFSKILVARKPGENGKRGEIEHINFAESKWGKDAVD